MPKLSDERIAELAIEAGLGCKIDVCDSYPLGICWYDGDQTHFARAIEAEVLASQPVQDCGEALVTSYDLTVKWENELRISKSGMSVKCGERIVAKAPLTVEQFGKADGAWQQWFDDAEKLCDGWNEALARSGQPK